MVKPNPQTTNEPFTIQEVIEKVRMTGDVNAAIYIQTFAQQKVSVREEDASRKLNAVRLAYGLLWHVKTDNRIVHKARHVLLDWLNDRDQQRIGIEESKEAIKGLGHV